MVTLRLSLVLPLAALLLLALGDARTFSSRWVATSRRESGVYELLAALRTPDLQWVNTPFGEQFWIEPALRQGLSSASVLRAGTGRAGPRRSRWPRGIVAHRPPGLPSVVSTAASPFTTPSRGGSTPP